MPQTMAAGPTLSRPAPGSSDRAMELKVIRYGEAANFVQSWKKDPYSWVKRNIFDDTDVP